MALFQNQILTNVGHDALSIALGGGRLTFYKMQAGQGRMIDDTDDTELENADTLIDEVLDFPIINYRIDGKGQITLIGVLASDMVLQGFNLTEIGVFATIEDPGPFGGTPALARYATDILVRTTNPKQAPGDPIDPPGPGDIVLYSLCNAGGTGDYIPGIPDAGSTDVVNVIEVTIVIDRADNVIINLLPDPNGGITMNNIGAPTVGAGVYARMIPDPSNNFWFKRLVMGPNIEIVEDAETVTIGFKTLTVDLDTYVANGNPNVFPDFSTIQNAHNYLLDYNIPSNIVARINVAAGRYVQTVPTTITHPNASQIQILGAPIDSSITITNAGTLTGGVGNWTWSFTVSDTTGLAIGDGITITGGPTNGIVGHCLITNIVGTTVSVLLRTTFPLPGGSVLGALITTYPSKIAPINSNGFELKAGIGLLANFSICPDSTSTNASIDMINLDQAPAYALLNNIGAAGNCRFGVRASGSGIQITTCNVAVGNCNGGLLIQRGAFGQVSFSLLTGHVTQGLNANSGSVIELQLNNPPFPSSWPSLLGNFMAYSTVGVGIYQAAIVSFFNALQLHANGVAIDAAQNGITNYNTPNSVINFQTANTLDIRATTGSMLSVGVGNSTGGAKFSPANGVFGPDGALIQYN
jgi:hypothetical protein